MQALIGMIFEQTYIVVVCISFVQVVNKFVDRIQEEEAMGTPAGVAVEAMKARQIAFLKRDAAEAGLASRPQWKSRKLNRVGARNWILHLDNQACMHCL